MTNLYSMRGIFARVSAAEEKNPLSIFVCHSNLYSSRLCVCVSEKSPTDAKGEGWGILMLTTLLSNSLFLLQGQDYSCQTGSHHSCVCVCAYVRVRSDQRECTF